MIKKIPYCFRDVHEDYLVLQSLQKFCSANGIKTNDDKFRLINNILNFANSNEDNERKTLEWFDSTLKEGVKKLIVTKIQGYSDLKDKSKPEWIKLIKKGFSINESKYILTSKHEAFMKLCSYSFSETEEKINKVSLTFTKCLKEKKERGGNYSTIIYPVFVDIYLDKGYMVGRAKSKSSIFNYDAVTIKTQNTQDDEDLYYKRTDCDKLILEAFNKIIAAFDISKESMEVQMHNFKSSIHKIVEECTQTPIEINNKLNAEYENREKFIRDFFNKYSIDFNENENYLNAQEDLKIFMEKYLSITCKDKKIFTEDRYGYPTKLAATDTDFSSIEETSINDNPLQCTPIFFDNKKLIHKQKKCDNMIFIFKRKPEKYFTANKYEVFFAVKKGALHIAFRKYTLEEDIQNVLSRII